MIHHETISARRAKDEGAGNFDVIESGGHFTVYEQSFALGEYPTLRSAVAAAKREAADFDRHERIEAMQRRHMTDLSAKNLARYGLRLGAYDGGTGRRFCLFEQGRSLINGEAVEVRREFASKRERDAKALELLRIAVTTKRN